MRWPISLLLLGTLAACATKGDLGAPPAHLLLDCPAPAMQAATNGELASTLNAYRWALRACNDDKAALREWAKEN